ncbi:SDR family NAD(P)-dependent oxidoreductase [Halorientalis litorea]|jgi:NAD(P)-dependent dehydrogenase (short-subunit alcohol dehydrogenase family)|uniref:SDR family NAD(P)-dependent oxidoreductase n=1 Tax=Halorientalis litorea TaxID=2931977 RepID=UPI001FF5EA7E|nr:glucose 1-dehydrogenase [Halorientalis litorea]
MVTTEFRIPGSVAIVTGSSSGIGKRIAEQFAADGIDTVVCSREQGNVDPVANEINESDRPGRALPIECDVRDEASVESMVERTVEEFGGLDILVNNAGAAFMVEFDEMSRNAWDTILDINLNGVFNCTHAASDALKDGGGSVVNVSSVRGQEASPNETHYGAAKAAVENFTKSLAHEWAEDDVRVNCVAPGFIATKSAVSAGDVDPAGIDRSAVDRRIGRVEEIADVVEFLVSDAASFVIGEVLTVRGVPTHSEKPER